MLQEVKTITMPVPLGADRGLPFTVRTATVEDVSFIDMLQKRYCNEVGFLPLAALENHIQHGRVAIGFENDEPAAYILCKSPYQKDAAMGIMYQAAVEYSAQRRLLGTALVEHAISLLPPTVRLISAWVAQDIEANFFWESCGFAPIAARKGSKYKGRVHIFWQRRRMTGATTPKLRHPKATSGGVMREKRAVVGLEQGAVWGEIDRESIPEVEPELSLAERVQRVRYSSSPWMYLIVNGVGRYLPTQDVVDVPGFMQAA